ncbi:MAG: glycosyltransferase [Candidatus Omnitrophota bacterium]
MSRQRILHILWDGGTGGAERFLKDITAFSDQTRFEHIVCFLSQGGWVTDEVIKGGIEVHVLGMKNGWFLPGAWRLWVLIRRVRPDLIHNHALNYLANAALRLFPGIPRMYFEHGGEFLAPKPSKEIVFYDLFGRYFDRILANSEFVRQRILSLTKVDPAKVEVFYIGIDPLRHQRERDLKLRASLGIPEAHKVVGIIGRLVEMKGIDDFIRIAAEIRKLPKSFECSFLIIGDGDLRPSLEALAKELGVPVIFLGDRADVPDLLPLIDVLVFTSKWEPFGMVILEAMATRVPVVGFPTDGAAEIMAKGGAIAVRGRDVRQAAGAVVNLLEHPEKMREFGAQGTRNVAANFDIRSSVKKLEAVYLDLLENRS